MPQRRDSRLTINEQASSELIFAVVGPVGSGTTWVAEALSQLAKAQFSGVEIIPIKASSVIDQELGAQGVTIAANATRLERATRLQDGGDTLRSKDPAAVASLVISAIKRLRAGIQSAHEKSGVATIHALTGETKKITRIYIVDSLKHPAEVQLLRAVYREAFCLIGVVCETTVRKSRLQNGKCKDSTADQIDEFMKRDEDASESWGQHVADTFHLADFFVDNTPNRLLDAGIENKEWVVNDKLGRLLDILAGEKIVRPSAAEIGMFHASGAQLRSACLSRQVGAALTDKQGNVIATGTNEVPRAGGGVYGGQFDVEPDAVDHRCAYTNKYCSNTRVQDEMMTEVITAMAKITGAVDVKPIKAALKGTAMGRLLEFSRAVHAEMDALLAAARTGAPTAGAKMFVTTFPCHYCARHLVAAGVEEVQYIEPYPKSKAFDLHSDSIEQIFTKWFVKPPAVPTKVLFRPFTGVAPRLYGRAFLKNKKMKDSDGNLKVGLPDWAPGLLEMSYLQLEDNLEPRLSSGE